MGPSTLDSLERVGCVTALLFLNHNIPIQTKQCIDNMFDISHKAKSVIRSGMKAMLRLPLVWEIVARTVVRPSSYACVLRDEILTELASLKDPQLYSLLSLRRVLGGPFAGLDYGDVSAKCSALFPKLLGSYEAELHPYLVTAIQQRPDQVIVVGAAEGYYVAGLAALLPKAQVIAFEGSSSARRQLIKLCNLNGVMERVRIRGLCSAMDLCELPTPKSLILVDCEGAEADILTTNVISRFANSEFIVELHDGYRPGVTSLLETAFACTHITTIVNAVHDLDRPEHFPLLGDFRLDARENTLLLRENRTQACLRWLVAKPSGAQ